MRSNTKANVVLMQEIDVSSCSDLLRKKITHFNVELSETFDIVFRYVVISAGQKTS